MPNAVALMLTFAEAGALFEAATTGLNRKSELGLPVNELALDALMKIGKGMGLDPRIVNGTVRLLPPIEG